MANSEFHLADSQAAPGGRRWLAPAAMLGFVALVHVAWWLFGDTVVHYRSLVDSDGYAHLLRVERLLATGDWTDNSLPRANAPYGGALHWTRLFDMLLLALATPLMPALGVKAALYWSGALISPLLHLGLAAALAWAARPLIGGAAALIAGALTAVQFGVLGYATVGHADHHVLLALLAVAAFGFTVRALLDADVGDGGVRHALAAGAALALGTWAGAEAQVPTALAMLVLGLPWLKGDAGAGARSFGLALGLVAGLTLALLFERGPAGFFAVEYDRVSVVHLTQASLVAVFWSAMASLRRRGREPAGAMTRLLAAVAGVALSVALMRLLFPRVLIDPLKDFDPVILRIFQGVSEYSPVADVSHFLLYLGVAVIALPWALRRLNAEWPGHAGWAWLLVVLSATTYLAMALSWIRWSLYADAFLLVSLADALIAADAAIDRRFAPPARLPVKAAAIVALAVGPLAVGAVGVVAGGKAEERPAPAPLADDPRPCPVKALSRFLAAPPWGDEEHTVLASANFGAEILYRTRHRVTATLHHRNAAGILDSVRILGGTDAAEIRRLIGARQVDLIVLCRFGGNDAYFWKGRPDDVFYRRLEKGDVPSWIAEVALPAELSPRFRLFRVKAE